MFQTGVIKLTLLESCHWSLTAVSIAVPVDKSIGISPVQQHGHSRRPDFIIVLKSTALAPKILQLMYVIYLSEQ